MRIKISNGEVQVDRQDAWLVRKYRWRTVATNTMYPDKKYAMSTERINGKQQYMHRFILGDSVIGLDTDHVNGDGLDNRRRNIRPATRTQNLINVGPHSNNKSGYKCVSFDSSRGLWIARARDNEGRYKFFGRFKTAKEAAAVVKQKALEHHGEFARNA